jgi:hypothetical protein
MILRCRVVSTSDLAIEMIANVTLCTMSFIVTAQLTLESHSETGGASRLTMKRMHVLDPSRGPRGCF